MHPCCGLRQQSLTQATGPSVPPEYPRNLAPAITSPASRAASVGFAAAAGRRQRRPRPMVAKHASHGCVYLFIDFLSKNDSTTALPYSGTGHGAPQLRRGSPPRTAANSCLKEPRPPIRCRPGARLGRGPAREPARPPRLALGLPGLPARPAPPRLRQPGPSPPPTKTWRQRAARRTRSLGTRPRRAAGPSGFRYTQGIDRDLPSSRRRPGRQGRSAPDGRPGPLASRGFPLGPGRPVVCRSDSRAWSLSRFLPFSQNALAR